MGDRPHVRWTNQVVVENRLLKRGEKVHTCIVYMYIVHVQVLYTCVLTQKGVGLMLTSPKRGRGYSIHSVCPSVCYHSSGCYTYSTDRKLRYMYIEPKKALNIRVKIDIHNVVHVI